jgi:hypothetical protein
MVLKCLKKKGMLIHIIFKKANVCQEEVNSLIFLNIGEIGLDSN